MNDPVKWALWVGCAGLAIVVVCFVYVVWVNAGSRNLALGFGALVGACVIFVLQLVFEIRGSQTVADFASEFSFDRSTQTVRSLKSFLPRNISGDSLSNLVVEDEASKLLHQQRTVMKSDDIPAVAKDLTLVSIISVFLSDLPDWQLDAATYKTVMGTMKLWFRTSTPDKCTLITTKEIKEKLRAAGNIFASIDRFGLGNDFCAPPGYALEITPTSVSLRGLVSTLSFAVRTPFASMDYGNPATIAQAIVTQTPVTLSGETLADGAPRYVNITLTGRVTVDYSPYRAQYKDVDKYRAWTSRAIDGVSARFGLAP